MYKLVCLCTCFSKAKSQLGQELNPGPLAGDPACLTPLLAAPIQSGQSWRVYLLFYLEVGDVCPAPDQPPPQPPPSRRRPEAPHRRVGRPPEQGLRLDYASASRTVQSGRTGQRFRISLISTRSPQLVHRGDRVRAAAEQGRRGPSTKPGGLDDSCEYFYVSWRDSCQQCLFCSRQLPFFLPLIQVGLTITRWILQLESNTIQLNWKDGSAGSPPIEGSRLADLSWKHPFTQLNFFH